MRWIVVGAGPAGCVAAARLADDPRNQVVLVERGPDLREGDVPAAVTARDFTRALSDRERVDRSVMAERGLDRTSPYTLGRGVGGSGAINAMVADRGDDAQYTRMGVGGSDEIERAWRAMQIPHETPDHRLLGGVSRALLAADGEARPPQMTFREGRRVTAAEAYLWPRVDGSSLAVTPDTPVRRIVLDERRVVGVETEDGRTLDADRVVVAAGALSTPALLHRSGVTVTGLGENLSDHPTVTLVLERRAPDDPAGSPAIGAVLRREGFQLMTMDRTGVDRAGREHGALLIALMSPVALRGSVALTADHALPKVRFGELPDDDVTRLVAALTTARGLLGTQPFADVVDDVFVDELGTGVAALDEEGAESWVRRSWSTLSHATGTCAMGRVVDRNGAVAGHSGLYVCDASVFPVIPDVNTHLPTMMLAELLAARWRTMP